MACEECEIFHASLQRNMLILSPNRCIQKRFAVCICIRSWGVSSRGAARVQFECFDRSSCFLSETCRYLLFPLEYKTGGSMLVGDGIQSEGCRSDIV